MAEFRLYDFKNNNIIKKPNRKESKNWTDKEWQEFFEKGNKIQNEKEKLKKITKSEDVYFNFGIPVETQFGYLVCFLRQYKVNIMNCSI